MKTTRRRDKVLDDARNKDATTSSQQLVRHKWRAFCLGGFIEGQVEVRTDIRFVLKTGVDAEIVYSRTFTSDLINVGLPGLSYGVVTIGPRISVGTRVGLQAAAKGRLLAGAEMGLQDAHSTEGGWEPYFKPVFEAQGELMLSATLGLPIGIKEWLKWRLPYWEQRRNVCRRFYRDQRLHWHRYADQLAQLVVNRHVRYEADTSAGHQRPAPGQKLYPQREHVPGARRQPDNVDCSELWATVDDVLVYDGDQVPMHYYNNTMSTLGVSRVCFEAELEAPAGSVVVFWAPYYDPESPDEYLFVAIDLLDQIFYPIVCDYEDGTASKVFLAQDPVAGVATLQSPDAIYSITGGRVSACYALVLNQGTRQ
ncbi:hypothetical protein LZ31DRAFT_593416 [Colletotrichum somersetense]|nr:hypothetical protein LZ31DRAFT_593416 [Colletotrichum somersetense]